MASAISMSRIRPFFAKQCIIALSTLFNLGFFSLMGCIMRSIRTTYLYIASVLNFGTNRLRCLVDIAKLDLV